MTARQPSTPRMPARGRYTMTRRLGTCSAPTPSVIAHADALWAEELRGELPSEDDARTDRQDQRALGCRIAVRSMLPRPTCEAPAPATCQGTDGPPPTRWQRYAAERLAGVRVPPSASVWREQDRRRQAAAERESRGAAPVRPAGPVPWGPGPSCEPEPLTHPGRKAVG